jgi:hypothetical protein
MAQKKQRATEISDPNQMLEFILSGEAVFTLVSKRTGGRYTYRVIRKYRAPGKPLSWYVRLLTGGDNTKNYVRMGKIRVDKGGYPVYEKKGGLNSPQDKGFAWLIHNVVQCRTDVLDQAQLLVAIRCRRCRRLLTTPKSILAGIGPKCAVREGG